MAEDHASRRRVPRSLSRAGPVVAFVATLLISRAAGANWWLTLTLAAYALYFVGHIVLDSVESPDQLRKPRWWFDFGFITAACALCAVAAVRYT